MLAQLQTQISQAEQTRAELELAAALGQEQLSGLRARRNAAAENASHRLAKVATLEERHRSAAAGLERLEYLALEMTQRVEALQTQIESAAAETQQRETQNQELALKLVEFDAERNACETRDSPLQFESEQVRARPLDDAAPHPRPPAARTSPRIAPDLSATAAKLQSDAHYMAESCLNELGLQRHELMADTTIPIASGEQLTLEDQVYREMRTRLDAMGPVNMMALEEYKETAERHAFLETQRKDLYDSIENTQATIKEIDTFSRQKFEEAFNKINENFQATFFKLFGGGHAYMRLTDEENSAESGIDVVASPPGKKLQNVLLLSGGEKAMTALALLVGIFQYQPSPFCILDEVDAPLDEANIGRFTELVKEMAVQTQFVLITHSKKTMSIAPVLYGVTMQEPGVSKLVSVRFGATA